MSLIKFNSIVSCSSEDEVHRAENLLNSNKKKWLSAKGSADRLTCILQLDKSSSISSIEIGNDGCGSIELFVSSDDDWNILLPTTTLMTTKESNSNTNRNQVKKFQSSDLNPTSLKKQWKQLKIICEQKINRSKPFGLQFIKLYSSAIEANTTSPTKRSLDMIEDDDSDETEEEQQKIGSFFTKRQAEKKLKNFDSSPEQQKPTSSNVASELLSTKSQDDSPKSPVIRKSVRSKQSTGHVENDKTKLMSKITFVLSGFQNPLRSELRNKATSMGATYSDDWNEKCTHLICAFPNTPKMQQVQQAGNGFIVNQQWIIDCFDQNQLISEKNYQMADNQDGAKKRPTLEKKTSVSKSPEKPKTPVQKKTITAKQEDPKKKKDGELPDFFKGIHFYVSYGDFDDQTLLAITRVILAYDGTIESQINEKVKYVITKRMWNRDFEKISKNNPEVNFVSLDWLQDCHDANTFAPVQTHLIVPSC